MGVCVLAHTYNFRYLLLCQATVNTEISDSLKAQDFVSHIITEAIIDNLNFRYCILSDIQILCGKGVIDTDIYQRIFAKALEANLDDDISSELKEKADRLVARTCRDTLMEIMDIIEEESYAREKNGCIYQIQEIAILLNQIGFEIKL